MADLGPCPDVGRLERFLLGQLPLAEIEGLAGHVETCAGCIGTLDTLRGTDLLVEAVRGSARLPDDPPGGGLDGLIDRITDLLPVPSAGPTGTAAGTDGHAVLAPSQGPGEIGRLGPYVVRGVLGAGGMGIVFAAEDPALRRPVALKVMRPGLARRESARRRFLREARAAAALSHDHVVPVYHVGEDRGVPFLAMPLLSGESLEARLRRPGRVPVPEAVRIGREVALGLAAAHGRGLIHRDVKPANLWLEAPTGRVKVLDFGLARPVDEATELTESGAAVGTPGYMAPEQARGGRLDTRADLFGLGCVLYRLCTGRLPDAGVHSPATARLVGSEAPPAPGAVNPAVPPALSDLILRLLAESPAGRPESAAAVAAELAAIGSAPPPRPRRRRVGLALAAALLLALGPVGYLYGPAVVRVATNRGQLVIDPGPDVEVVLKQGGQQVQVIDTRTGRTFDIRAGDYDIEIVELPDGIRTTTRQLTLRRGGRQVLNVRLELAKAKPGKAGRQPGDPWPADSLRREQIPEYELMAAGNGDPAKAPEGLVAVLGDSRLKHWQSVHSVAASPDGKAIATGSFDGTAKVWDVASGREAFTFVHAAPVHSVSYSADGMVLASASTDGSIKLWDPTTGRNLKSFEVKHAGRFNDAVLSPDKKTIASGGWEDHTVRLWSAESGRELFTLEAGSRSIHRVAFDPDSRLVAAASHDGAVRIWTVADGKPVQTLRPTARESWAVAFSPDGKQLACGDEECQVTVWDSSRWERRHTLVGHKRSVHSLAFRHDGALASGDFGGVTKLWDCAEGAWTRDLAPHMANVSALAFCGKTPILASASLDNSVRLRDSDSGLEAVAPDGPRSWLDGLAVHPDGDLVAAGGHDRLVHVWSLARGVEVQRLPGHEEHVTGVAFAPDGRYLATAGKDGRTKLWETTGWKARTANDSNYVWRVAFSPDGRTLAAATGEGKVKLRDVAGWAEARVIEGPRSPLLTLAYRPDGKVIAAAGDSPVIRLWDPDTGFEQRALEGHAGAVIDLGFRADGRVLASAGDDNAARLWDPDTGKERFRLTGRRGAVFAGREVATYADGCVYLWDSDTGRATRKVRLGPPGASVNRLAVTPDGRHLATANGNGTVYIFRLPAAGK